MTQHVPATPAGDLRQPAAAGQRPAARPVVHRRVDAARGSRAIGAEGGPLGSELASRIAASSGTPLEPALRADMEAAFGTDLGAVRIHRASDTAPALSARAFTVGTDVHFAPGEYRPVGTAGRRLIAHELAHVVQHGGASPAPTRVRRALTVGAADDAAEREADRLADWALARPRGVATTDPRSDATADHPVASRIRRRSDAGTVRREVRQFVSKDMIPAPTMKEEIAAQYTDGPSEAFDALWKGSFLIKLHDRQKSGQGLPRASRARLIQANDEDRSQNNAVRVHGWIGSLEAALRGSGSGGTFIAFKRQAADEKDRKKREESAKWHEAQKLKETMSPTTDAPVTEKQPEPTVGADTTKSATVEPKRGPVSSKKELKANQGPKLDPPYDGGHLVGFQFMGDKANTFDNVAPQGKALNNGPFQTWEKNVLAKALDRMVTMLDEAGVTVANRPHLMEYQVYVDYSSSRYTVAPAALALHGLIPPSDVDRLPPAISLIKRIPVGWRAFAYPRALPSAEEMGIARRPNTPYMFDKTADYGVVDKSNKERTNQEYMARGPEELVRPFTTGMSLDSVLKPLATNQAKTTFHVLLKWAQQGSDTIDLKEVSTWRTQAQLAPTIVIKSPHVARTHNGEYGPINSDWTDAKTGVTYTPKDIRELIDKVNVAKKDDVDAKSLGAIVERYVQDLKKVLNALRLVEGAMAPSKRPATKDTKVDFSGPGALDTGLLADVTPFQFFAAETQPD